MDLDLKEQQAIITALDRMNDGYDWIVEIDLEKCFDTVNHDKLMTLIGRSIKDGEVISIIRKFLDSGIMVDDEYKDSVIGTPQGGNLSPLLANIMLNGLKYLGFGFYFDIKAHQYKAKPHAKSVTKFKERRKQLICRSWGVSNTYKVQKLNKLIRGWINYFKIGSMKQLCREMDKHIRYRIRMCIWKHWKTPQNRAKNLIKLGVPRCAAWRTAYAKGYARVCRASDVSQAINNKRLASFGLVSMLDYYTERCVTC